MVKSSKESKEQALLLSDDIGVKKGAEQLVLNYSTPAEWRKTRSRKAREEHSIGQNAVERAGACHAARNTGAEKSEV